METREGITLTAMTVVGLFIGTMGRPTGAVEIYDVWFDSLVLVVQMLTRCLTTRRFRGSGHGL